MRLDPVHRPLPPWTPEQRQAWGLLDRLRGPGELRALLLSLLLTPDSARERQAWAEECAGVHGAEATLECVAQLPAHARLVVMDAVLERLSALDLSERQHLLAAARRVMCADGRVRPIDRLTLMLIRHHLRATPPLARARTYEPTELTDLALPMRQAIASASAHLARLVPTADANAAVGAAGARWYRAVLAAAWGSASAPPACQVPDADALAKAFTQLRGLGWMRRPVLARAWFDAAMDVADGMDEQLRPDDAVASPPPNRVALDLGGAEALRIACGLLDTPLPPGLAARFSTLPVGD